MTAAPSSARLVRSTGSDGWRGVRLDDAAQGPAQLLALGGAQISGEPGDFDAYLVVHGDRGSLAGRCQRHPKCSAVAWHGLPFGEATPLDPVRQAGEGRLLDAEDAA